MLGNVLRADRAVEVSLMVVRTFVQLREMLSTHKELVAKFEALERKSSAGRRRSASTNWWPKWSGKI
jgi:hypothetical protein